MNDKVEISPYHNLLEYKKSYSLEFIKRTILTNNLAGLSISGRFDEIESLDFLADFSFLEKLSISCWYNSDLSFLKELPNLKYLNVLSDKKITLLTRGAFRKERFSSCLICCHCAG